MRCPKCSYTSFDYLDRCRSCGEDLVPTKIKLNIYTKAPEMDMDDDGFVVGKVDEEKKDLLGNDSVFEGGEVSMEDVLHEDGDNLENFDFSNDK